MSELQATVRGAEAVKRVESRHKELHAAISALSKGVDKALGSGGGGDNGSGGGGCGGGGLMSICRPVDPPRAAVEELAAAHLYRTGRFRAAARLVSEAGLDGGGGGARGDWSEDALREMHGAVAALAADPPNTEPAQAWAAARRGALRAIDSDLEVRARARGGGGGGGGFF